MGGGLAANDIPMKDYFFIYFPLHSMSFYSVCMNIFMSDQWMDYIFSTISNLVSPCMASARTFMMFLDLTCFCCVDVV